MRHLHPICAALLMMAAAAPAQVSSHAPTTMTNAATSLPPAQMAPAMQVSDKPVARVNGAVLTDRDLLREMYSIFPYAQQHNGFPKAQEAVRRKMTVPAAKLNEAQAQFRKQFDSPEHYQQYLQSEMKGSEQQLRQQIKRSILIEEVLKTDVEDRSSVSLAEVKAYYDKNPAKYVQPESFTFQSISVMPPLKPTAAQAAEAKKNADAALQQAKATKSYQEFGLLAEKISEDDFRVNMGDHKAVGRDKLPPQVVKALLAMQPGQVSGLIQIESAYTIIRLNAHTPAKKQSLKEVQAMLKDDLQKNKYEKLRSGLAKQLRAKAKIEVV